MEKKSWENQEAFLNAVENKTQNISLEFIIQSRVFSTWYYALKDQASLPYVDYLKQGMVRAKNSGEELMLPPQDLYRRVCDVASAYMAGSVDVKELNAIQAEFTPFQKAMLDHAADLVLQANKRDEADKYKGGIGLPKVITDALYIIELTDQIRENITDKGHVTLSDDERNYLFEVVGVEYTGLRRLEF